MIIQCDNCKRKFRLDDDRIQPPGARVRCSKCGDIFYVPVQVQSAENEVQLEFGGKNPFDDSSPLKDNIENEKIYDADSIASMIQTGLSSEEQDEPGVAVSGQTETEVESQTDEADSEREIIGSEEKETGQEHQQPGVSERPNEQYSGLQSGEDSNDAGSGQITNPFKAPELTVDRDVLYRTYPESKAETGEETAKESSGRVYRTRQKRGGFLKNFFIFVFTVFIIATLFVSGLYLLGQFNIVSKDHFDKYKKMALSYLPAGIGDKNPGNFLKITEDKGKWIDSRYGQVYVVSGKVLNTSRKTVNYIKLKSDFYSVDDLVYEQEFYAGNTLTSKEIKNLPFSSINERLKRKSGDVNYNDVDNLAGLNFGIKPGETVPFYTVYPSKSRILGLDYRISVIDFSISGGNSR